ncbi:MAG: COX15/CtaA family protein [Methylophilales bacterium]|nr:COX15/CtaA family protein [Methylophilales bacterium]
MYKKLILAAAVLALCVVVLGAYVRLSDAGLGCPDWPGCYGHITVPHSSVAETAFPDKPLETHKAWKEMAHRYFAGTLGLLILAIFVSAWRNRHVASPVLPSALLILVIFQAALGMWTVTLLLKPVIVSLHLIGGMATLGLLTWLSSRRLATVFHPTIRPWALLALLVLACQIILGGWTSTNYAALACPDFPVCQGMMLPPTDFANAFHLVRELGVNADGSQLSLASLTAIHLMHRLGALITFLYLGWFGSKLLKISGLVIWGRVLLGALLVQIALGISNVVFSLPLAVAVGHNAGAAILLVTLVVINSKLIRKDGFA